MIEDVVMPDSGPIRDVPETICGKTAGLAHGFTVARLKHAAVNERLAHSACTFASWATTRSRIRWP